MIDLHCDTLMKLLDEPQGGDLKANKWKIDIEKLKNSAYILQNFACYVDLRAEDNPYARYKQMLAIFNENISKYREEITHVLTYADIEKAIQEGKIAALLSVEEAGIIGDDLNKVDELYSDGVRLMTISWNYPNAFTFPQGETHEGKGLTKLGFELVEKMEDKGMIIDCSHLNDAGTRDLLNVCKKPFIASHSNARAITPHRRNLTDELISGIAEKGGVIGLNFAQAFLGTSKTSLIADIVRHAQYIYQIGGSEVLALGSDFDGINPDTEIIDASEMHRLIEDFASSGFSQADIDKIITDNARRVLKELL